MISSPWLMSSFDNIVGNCTVPTLQPSSSQKRPRIEKIVSSSKIFSDRRHEKNIATDILPWTEKFTPKAKEQLAVHKKKVEQVECWLKKSLSCCNDKVTQSSGAPLLILTGPAGAGKTATIIALAAEMGLEVQEWINPCQFPRKYGNTHYEMDFDTNGGQIPVFTSFLLRANKYSSLFSDSSQKKIILIEDFPNIFLQDASSFHEILQKFKKTGRCPAIFIVTDSTSGESIEHFLFPKDLQSQLEISNISFNPVAPTMLIKALTKISAKMSIETRSERLTKTDLEKIAASAKGDIRSAINTLQYTFTKRKNKSYIKQPRKKQKLDEEENEIVTGRDTSLFLFHALGKVLYCKRDGKLNDNIQKLPPHLQHLERVPLIEDPEELFMKTTISADGFNLFLQQNYLSFVDDVEVAAKCSTWLSEADLLSSDWRVHGSFDNYSASIAIRGLMFNLVPYSERSGRTWKSMQKSAWHAARKTYDSLSSSVRRSFKAQRLTPTELQTELLPLLSKIKLPLQIEQQSLVDQVGILKRKLMFSTQPESLCEKDVYKDDQEVEDMPNCNISESTSNVQITDIIVEEKEEEEEIVIEEYDD